MAFMNTFGGTECVTPCI